MFTMMSDNEEAWLSILVYGSIYTFFVIVFTFSILSWLK